MIRAGVFIGVDQTGGLHRLRDAGAGARRMHAWALCQGMVDQEQAVLITDEGGTRPVDAHSIYKAVKTLVQDGAGIDQLIVYFAGHGVNINMSEQWLLTDAPEDTSAAVNVRGSVELARYCGVRHIVFISDACRVAPQDIQAQNVRGVDIFPNSAAADRAKPVDQFFACLLGRPANEIRDAQAAAETFHALYTDELLQALSGQRPHLLELADDLPAGQRCLKPMPLQAHLEVAIPQIVTQLRLQGKVNQNPDAILTAHSHWIASVAADQLPSSPAPIRTGVASAPRIGRTTLRSIARLLVDSAMSGDQAEFAHAMLKAKTIPVPGADVLASGVEAITAPFGLDAPFASGGISVRGRKVADAYARWADVRPHSEQLLEVQPLSRLAASVLLQFEDGTGAVVPALQGFVAGLTFDEDELVDLAYEPVRGSDRGIAYEQRADEIRALRAVAAAASKHGRFRLDQARSAEIAVRMQYAQSVDPTLAIYTAYAYHDLQSVARIRQMTAYLQADLGVRLFDLALLGRELIRQTIDARSNIVPFTPLLAQGWALLNANELNLHRELTGIASTLGDSLWSLYDARGVKLLRAALASGDLL
jgi:hypothetical protein